MLPLHGTDTPANSLDMAQRLRTGLERVVRFTAKSSDSAVRIDGEYPRIGRLEIDFSETVLRRPPQGKPVGIGRTKPGPTVEQLRVVGRPIHCEGVPVQMELTAEEVRFLFDVDSQGQMVLVPVEAQGRFEGRVPQSGLETMLLNVAREAAEKQSVTIRSAQLTLQQQGTPRTLKALVRIEATKRIGIIPLSGAFLVTGLLEVSDDLVAEVSQLGCEGEGALASMVAPLIADRLRQFNHRQLELAAIPLGDIRLQDLRVDVSNQALLLHAAFGT